MCSFVSCRDSARPSDRRRYSFREAILSGWAEDGGMIMSEKIPQIPAATISDWRRKQHSFSYPECCYHILRMFIPKCEIPDPVLRKLIVSDAFADFGHKSVICKRQLSSLEGQHISVLELFHGPTLAFKDLGMQVLCKILGWYLEKTESSLNLLVGTSGDTGSSAIEASKEIPRMTVTVLYPGNGRISRLQELQMVTQGDTYTKKNKGVKVIGVDGTSDDLDRPIEAVFGDVAFRKKHSIGSVNSVNICRVLVQVAHFVWSALKADSNDINFYVPTGAGGHVTAGVIARRMMIEDVSTEIKLHICTNENDAFHRILSTGVVSSSRRENIAKTVAPSMDIGVPYNLERLMWIAAMVSGAGDESEQTKLCAEAASLMRAFKETGSICLPQAITQGIRDTCGISSSSSHSDRSILGTIKRVRQLSGYVIDPHTAVGVSAAFQSTDVSQSSAVSICMACAHPSKFSNVITNALGNPRDPWWWLDESNRSHSSVSKLLALDRIRKTPVCEYYEENTNWTYRLRSWFERQTLEQSKRTAAETRIKSSL